MKLNEKYTARTPSGWFYSDFANIQNQRPPLPDDVPPADQLIQDNHDHFAVKQCPYCNKIWQRDVNACR
jgi:transposase